MTGVSWGGVVRLTGTPMVATEDRSNGGVVPGGSALPLR